MMAALALVLVGAGLVQSMDETFKVAKEEAINISMACPDSCTCSWESGGGLSGAVCTAPMVDNLALGGNLRAL